MSETSVKGREVLLKRPPMTIFSLFSDLSLLVQNVPEEYGGRIQADKDSVHIEYKGIKFGIVVDRREQVRYCRRQARAVLAGGAQG